ncbi:lycopene cyclase domain-containing protein [Pareuzebyella sediminis]|uniref:lycopene cyclase domain-containing protein n=1 Tax=Pareuzebyella sediminis TaxID=2607998 RepID=UPI0011EBA6AA|nr:lycopene cyclase domain-containing protein [Pareuzebyella sediminis]
MNPYLYLIIDLLSFSVPFIYSFERKRIHFIQYWKPYFGALLLVGSIFIIWDVFFTIWGVWGFNDDYLIGWRIATLPIEEWLFFLLIPYASNFIHYALVYFLPRFGLPKSVARFLPVVFGVVALSIAIMHFDRLYTVVSFGLFSILMFLQTYYRPPIFRTYMLSFLLILIPFLVVNSWLTGSFTNEPIVFYNNTKNLGIRLGTIPVEDFFYCFSLLYSNILIFEYLKKRFGYQQIDSGEPTE